MLLFITALVNCKLSKESSSSHTYLCSARFIVRITQKYDNDKFTSHLSLCMLYT